MVTISSNPCTLTAPYHVGADSTTDSLLRDSHVSLANSLSSTHQIVRVGAVSYLNSKPLIHGLSESLGASGKLTTDLPSRLADQLIAGDIDVGLIPVFEYLRTPELKLVSKSAIVSRGPVWSVRLFFRTEPERVKRIAMDEGSRTSVALTKVLLREMTGRIPETTRLGLTDEPNEIDADAILMIGDRAMHPEQYTDHFSSNWDLGEKWKELTGLPFVFAAWVTKDSSIDQERLAKILDETRRNGVAAISEISQECAGDYRLDTNRCTDYLTNYIFYELDKDAARGLEEFRRRCHDFGMISPHANR